MHSTSKADDGNPDLVDRELLLKEAEWVWSEMEDFVKQIQRYRLSYVTALFASIGWVLGQLVDSRNTALTLAELQRNSAVATIVLLVPMINGLFFLLMMEAAFQVQVLARYRFLLSTALGAGRPVWRWELFKATDEGSVRHWTNPSNAFLGLFAIGASIGAFIFVNPAVGDPLVNAVRWASVSFTAALTLAVLWAAWPRLHRNSVADPPPARLSPPESKRRPGSIGATYHSLLPDWAVEQAASASRASDISPPASPSQPAPSPPPAPPPPQTPIVAEPS